MKITRKNLFGMQSRETEITKQGKEGKTHIG